MSKFSLAALGGLMFIAASTMSAAALFTQCPPVGSNTGCHFLIQINADSTVSVLEDKVAPNNGPYDGADDTLIAVLNNSAVTIGSLPLSSSTDIFGFDGDGLCSVTPKPSGCNAQGNLNATDKTGYGGPTTFFSNINAAGTSGVVNFIGGLAPGASAFFALEEALQATQITPGPPAGGVPEPGSLALMGGGMGALLLAMLRRKAS